MKLGNNAQIYIFNKEKPQKRIKQEFRPQGHMTSLKNFLDSFNNRPCKGDESRSLSGITEITC